MLPRKFAFLLEIRSGKLVQPKNNLSLVKYEISAGISYFVFQPIFLRRPLQAECRILCMEIVNIEKEAEK